jgi:CheY-like chemotaxis protein
MLEPIATMRRNIELETRLIDDMLDVTRIARGKVEIEPVPLNLHEKIRHVLTICDKDIANKGLELQVDLAAADPRLSGDPARLQQVLWNLIKNAVKFTPDGGRIAVRTRQETQGALTIEVSDTGVGIEPQMLSRIFQAFEQGGRDVTRRFGGLGLGLTISKALVELHGGILTAQSAGPGQGSTFTVVLPRRHIAAAAPEAASLAGASVKAQCRILLVEDHHDTGRAMARVLAAAGHHVRTADTVGSALRLALSEPFDLIISDIGLPDGSGLDLMRQLRPHTRVKGIALSGFGRDDDIRRSKQAGFDMHLTKPVNLTRLKEAIQRLMV